MTDFDINKIYDKLEISGGNKREYDNYDEKDITIKHYIKGNLPR